MIPLSILDEIESRTFIADIGVVSTPRRFEVALSESRPVRELLGCLRTAVEQQHLRQRIRDILRLPSDTKYAHTYDVPLAVYLRALDIAAPSDAYELAQALRRLPNLWWAGFVAKKILSGPSLAQKSEYVVWNPSGARVRGVGSVPHLAYIQNFRVTLPAGATVATVAKASITKPSALHLHGDEVLTRAVATAA